MKSEKGITLITLIIYVIMMTLIVAGVTAITTSFRSNINEYDSSTESVLAFSKFNMYLLKDLKTKGVTLHNVSENQFELEYKDSSGKITKIISYSVQNNILYRDKIKICEGVRTGIFSEGPGENSLQVALQFKNYTKVTTYAVEGKPV